MKMGQTGLIIYIGNDKCKVNMDGASGTEVLLTKYLSEATLTSMRSSPTLTFSPSDLCFDAG